MATTNVNPGSSGPAFSGMSLNDAIDSIGGVTETTATETPAETQPETTEQPAVETELAQPEAEAAAEPAQQQQAQPEEEIGPLDEIQADREADGGKTLHFSRNKANALLAARDFQRRLAETIPDATIENLQENFRRTVELDRMLADHQSGDPRRVDGVLGSWINQQTNPQTALAMADSFPARLSQAHPQAFTKLEGNILSNWVNRGYNEALRSGDQRLLELVQNLDYRMTGKYRDAGQLQQRDPLAEERQRFDLERRQFQEQRQAEHQRFVDQQVSDLDRDIDNSIQQEAGRFLMAKTPDGKTIDDLLKAIPGDAQWKKFFNHEMADAVDEAMKANPAWKAKFDTEQLRFRDNPSDKGLRENLVNMTKQFARTVLARKAKELIDARTAGFNSENAAAHRSLQQAAERREPTAAGTPVQRATAAQKLADIKKRGGTLEEGFAALGI